MRSVAVCCAVVIAGLTLMACGQSEEEQLEERRQGLHCLNLGDHNESLYARVYDSLADPGSLRAELTVIGPVIDGEHRIKMDFTARNTLGQTVRGTAIGWVDNKTCLASLESIT
jgi:hypothetical protein